MSWWDDLHPEKAESSLGVPIPLDCARALAGEPVLIKNGFDGFHATKLHEILHQQGVDTLVIIGLITRFFSIQCIADQLSLKILHRACVLNTLMSAFNHGWDSAAIFAKSLSSPKPKPKHARNKLRFTSSCKIMVCNNEPIIFKYWNFNIL